MNPALKNRPIVSTAAFDFAADAQRVLSNERILARSRMEGELIASLINEHRLGAYLDLGCWYGLLAREVLARCSPGYILLADAGVPFLEIARSTIAPHRAHYLHTAVVSASADIKDGRARLDVNTADTSSSAVRPCDAEGVTLDAPARTIVQLLGELPAQVVRDAYLKLDLEGLDEAVMRDLAASPFRPAFLHFEYLPREWSSPPPGCFEFIRAAGYQLPAMPPSGSHMYYSVICGKSAGALVGFRPDVAYR